MPSGTRAATFPAPLRFRFLLTPAAARRTRGFALLAPAPRPRSPAPAFSRRRAARVASRGASVARLALLLLPVLLFLEAHLSRLVEAIATALRFNLDSKA